MKLVRMVALVALCLIAGWAAGTWQPRRGEAGKMTSNHAGVSIEQVQALATLVTTKVNCADAVETKLQGRTGSLTAAILVKGDFLVGTDLTRARFEAVNQENRTAVLVLPQPRVTSPRLDHERTRVVGVSESGLWAITPGSNQATAAVLQRAYREAQRYLADAYSDPSLLVQSRQQAEKVLGTFFGATGWRVSVRWEDWQ